MTDLLILFIILSTVNVILNTIKSLVTIKCGALMSAVVNAITFGFYTIVLVYTNCELDLWAKVVVTALTNFIGVYVVKLVEQKLRKDRLWRVDCTVDRSNTSLLDQALEKANISHNYIIAGKYTLFNCYCPSQQDSLKVKEILKQYNAKYFVTESKIL